MIRVVLFAPIVIYILARVEGSDLESLSDNEAKALEPQSDSTPRRRRSHCLDAVNKYRAKKGKSKLTMCSQTYQDKAKEQTEWDAKHGAHAWFKTKGTSGMCPHGSVGGQCEAMMAGHEDAAIAMYYKEGPGGGHYDILMSGSNKCVACGYCKSCYHGSTYYTHNFCHTAGLNTSMVMV